MCLRPWIQAWFLTTFPSAKVVKFGPEFWNTGPKAADGEPAIVSTGLEVVDCMMDVLDPRLVPNYATKRRRLGNSGLR